MTDKRLYWIYGSVFALSVCIFGYALFPEDKVLTHISILISRSFPGADVRIQSLGPALPFGAELNSVDIRLEEGLALKFQSGFAGYNILSSLGGSRSFSLRAEGYEGQVRGTFTRGKEAAEKTTADIRLTGIRLEKIEPVQEITNGLFSGILSGEITHDSAKEKDPTLVDLEISGCKIPVKLGFMDLGVMEFKEVLMEGALAQQNLEIRKCTFNGVQAEGEFSGRIAFAEVLKQSRLSLSGNINLHHEFLKTLSKNQGSGDLMPRNGFRFEMSGTFEQPKFSLRQ